MSDQGDTNDKQEKHRDNAEIKADATESANDAEQAPTAESVSDKFRQPELGKIEPPKPGKSVSTAKNNWSLLLLWLLVLLGLAASGWLYWQQTQQQQRLDTQLQTLQQDFQATKRRASEAEASAERSLKSFNQLQQDLKQAQQRYRHLQDSLLATQQQLQRLSGRRAADWRLAQAEYLLKLSAYHLTYDNNIGVALELLRAADEQVAAVGDQSLQPLREAIAGDIQTLRAIPQLDRAGVLAQLAALQDKVSQLSLLALQYQPEADGEKVPEQSGDSTWQKVYQQFLKDFVVIKEHAAPVQPMMTAEQRFFLDQSLILLINQAQVALLRQRADEYQQALRQLKQAVEKYFADDPKRQAFIMSIDELLQKPVAPHIPQSLQAADLIVRINQERLYQWFQPPDNELDLSKEQLENSDAQ